MNKKKQQQQIRKWTGNNRLQNMRIYKNNARRSGVMRHDAQRSTTTPSPELHYFLPNRGSWSVYSAYTAVIFPTRTMCNFLINTQHILTGYN